MFLQTKQAVKIYDLRIRKLTHHVSDSNLPHTFHLKSVKPEKKKDQLNSNSIEKVSFFKMTIL